MTPRENFRRIILWLSIALITLTAVMLQRVRHEDDAALASDEGGTVEERAVERPAIEATGPKIDPVSLEAQLAAKVTVALHTIAPQFSTEQLLGQADALRQGRFADQLGYAVLVGNFEGWSKGVEAARAIALPNDAVDEARALREEVVKAMELRASLADAGDAEGQGARNAAEPARATMGFFTDVLGPDAASKAWGAIAALIAAGAWYFVAFFGGLVALAVLAVRGMTGRARPAMQPAPSEHGALVLGETFALWIVLFLGLNVLSAVVLARFADSLGTPAHLAISISMMFGSLVVLGYPASRGVHWRELRGLIGLHTGRGVGAEVLNGLLCYITAVPLLAGGLVVFGIVTAIVNRLAGPQPAPSHPVVEMFGGAGGFQVMMMFMLASVTAPIVEEIMFRGCLYGHLRGTVAPRVRGLSMLVSAVASSVVFAIIHPQGVLFVPALGGLAVGFCIYREMRGSLIAPMVAHGINNAVTLAIGLALMS